MTRIPSTRKPQQSTERSALAEWWKIIALGVVLAGAVYFGLIHEPSPNAGLGGGEPKITRRVAVPEIDPEILREIDDRSSTSRLLLEPNAVAHFLDKSLSVVPSVADALGMPDKPIPIPVLQTNPSAYRGAYLWYEGELRYLSDGKPGHPTPGFKVYEGWIVTDEGHEVLFRVSDAPRNLKVGHYVRVEGFFLKLRDSHHMPECERAPLLVGPEVFPDFEPWDPVTAIDPDLVAKIQDGVFENGTFTDFQQAEDGLDESQEEPLWHVASYATQVNAKTSLGDWRKHKAFVSKEQLDAMKRGEVEVGTPIRLLGTFVSGQTIAARPNPANIDHWTEVWVQIRDLGGKIVPVWIPDRIGRDRPFRINENLEVRAHYLRRHLYMAAGSGDATMPAGTYFTPVFVAADLHRFKHRESHPVTNIVKYAFAGLLLAVIGLFVWTSRRDRVLRTRHEDAMVERRRKRREAMSAGQP